MSDPRIAQGHVGRVDDVYGSLGIGVAVEVSVTVKDGGTAVAVDASKLAGMFEATGDLSDWGGEAGMVASVRQTGSEGAVMRFEVVVGEGAEKAGFLRVAP